MIIKTPDAELVAIVKSGKNKMPSFQDKLTDDQIKAADRVYTNSAEVAEAIRPALRDQMPLDIICTAG